MESSSSAFDSDDLEEPDYKQKGGLITLNINLGAKGEVVLHGLSDQSAEVIADKFCKKHKLGPKLKL